MPQISIGTKVRVKGEKLRTMKEREDRKRACAEHPDLPMYPGMEGRVVGYKTEDDAWPIGQLPGDPLHTVKFGKKLQYDYWFEELELVM